jgi:hypothetical protein
MPVLGKHFLTIFGACGAAALAYFAHEVAGWIGVGVLGLLVAFIAVRLEIEQRGPVGHPRDTGLYTRSQMGHDQMTRAEHAAEQAEITSMLRAYNVAKVIGAVLIIIGFVGFFFLQLPE